MRYSCCISPFWSLVVSRKGLIDVSFSIEQRAKRYFPSSMVPRRRHQLVTNLDGFNGLKMAVARRNDAALLDDHE
jgi:hypothetical protein